MKTFMFRKEESYCYDLTLIIGADSETEARNFASKYMETKDIPGDIRPQDVLLEVEDIHANKKGVVLEVNTPWYSV